MHANTCSLVHEEVACTVHLIQTQSPKTAQSSCDTINNFDIINLLSVKFAISLEVHVCIVTVVIVSKSSP